MTVFVFLAGATKRHAVQDRHVVFDHGCFAADEAGRVIEENAAADRAAGLMSI